MQGDAVLPAFELDCRDWLVVTPQDAGLSDELAGAPLLAVLSTAVFGGDEFRCASAVLTVGLLDGETPPTLPGPVGGVAAELLDGAGAVRYLVPSPDGRLALVAEFHVDGDLDAELTGRIQALMSSFRWAA